MGGQVAQHGPRAGGGLSGQPAAQVLARVQSAADEWRERSQRATEVSQKIAAGWGGEQVLNGPYLAVPVSVNRSQTSQNGTITWQPVTAWRPRLRISTTS